VNNYITIALMMKIIKSAIGMIALAFTSLILITCSPFQIANNLVENTMANRINVHYNFMSKYVHPSKSKYRYLVTI
jgi:hypothetical protein